MTDIARQHTIRKDIQSWFPMCVQDNQVPELLVNYPHNFFDPKHDHNPQNKKQIMVQDESMSEENDLYPIILSIPQSDSCSSIDLDELLPIERQLLNSCSSLRSKSNSGVSFGKDFVVTVESSEDWSDEERDNAWFSPYDLEKCKKKAIKLCMRQAKGLAPKAEDSTRGMGVYFGARKQAHAEYVYRILCATEEFEGNPEYVAHLAESWSAANKINAQTIAVRDMYEAYFPHMMEQQNEVQSSNSHALSPNPAAKVRVKPDSFNRH